MGIAYSNPKSLIYFDEETGAHITRIHPYRSRVHYNSNYLANPRSPGFDSIRTRYLSMLLKTMRPNSLNTAKYAQLEKDLEILLQYDPSGVAKMFQDIQDGYTAKYNDISSKIIKGSDINNVIAQLYANRDLSNAEQKETFLEYLNQLIKVIDNNKKGFDTWQDIANYDNKNKIQFLSASDISFATKAAELLKPYMNTKLTDGTINSIIENATEYLPEAIGQAIEQGIKVTDKALLSMLPKNKVTKRQTKKGEIAVGFTGAQMMQSDIAGYENIKSKAADSYHLSNVALDTSFMGLGAGNSKIDVEMTIAVSTKQRSSNSSDNYLKLVSYSGSNSILKAALNEIWPGYEYSQEQSYAIYNGLAFKYNKGKDTDAPSQYYRIIRTNLIQVAAEKYLVGVRSNMAQQVLVYNGVAYPMLSIVEAIIDEAKNEKDFYGSTQNKKSFFSVRLDTTAAYANQWEAPKRVSIPAAMKRAERARKAINRIRTYGQLNRKMLEDKDFVKKYFPKSNIKVELLKLDRVRKK